MGLFSAGGGFEHCVVIIMPRKAVMRAEAHDIEPEGIMAASAQQEGPPNPNACLSGTWQEV